MLQNIETNFRDFFRGKDPLIMAQLHTIKTTCLRSPLAYTRISVLEARQERERRKTEGNEAAEDEGRNDNKNMFSQVGDELFGRFKGFMVPKLGTPSLMRLRIGR